MQTNESNPLPAALTDDELVAEVARLAASARRATASLVAHLIELDVRRLYRAAGCPSLFVYCTDVLRLSEHEAYNRIEAARVVRRFPGVLPMLADGSLNLTAVRLLSPRLTRENHEGLLAEAVGQGKRGVERLLARWFPLADVPASIRKLPAPQMAPAVEELVRPSQEAINKQAITDQPAADQATADQAITDPAVSERAGESSVSPARIASTALPATSVVPAGLPFASVEGHTPQPTPLSKRRDLVRPLAADRYEFRFTGSESLREKLQTATDLLRGVNPTGEMAEVIDRALTVLIEDLARKKFAASRRPRPAKKAAVGTRHVPAHVKRAVWARDGGRCAFVGTDDRRCRGRSFLEFHHVHPYGVGGEATVENIQLRCRAHNDYESEYFYGRRFRMVTEGEGGRELVPERVGP